MGAIAPLLAALLVLHALGDRPAAEGARPALAALATVGGWTLLMLGLGAWLARRGGRRLLRRVERAGALASVGALAWLCWDWGWAAWAPGWTVALAPWALMHAALWWGLAPAVSRVSGVPWSRRALALHHLRFDLAPVLIVLPILDLCEWLGARLGTLAWFSGWHGLLLSLAGGWLLVLALLALLPLALLPLWGAARLPSGPLAERLERDCAGLARLRLWRSPGGSVHNALAVGLVPGLRWVLVSDDLLADLPEEQARAVVGHELGHHRHGHLWLYAWFALAAMLASWLAADWAVGDGAPLRLPGGYVLPAEWVAMGVFAALALFWIRGPFAWLSQACERQADLAGAERAGATAMIEALRSVARLSGTPEDEPSWRHRSIAERVRFLRACQRQPALAELHHRFVARMRLAVIALLAVCATLAVSLWLDPLRAARSAADPARELAAWAAEAPDLARALAAADAGNSGPLIAWLSGADLAERQRLAWLLLGSVERLPADDGSLWRWRHRLAALAVVRLGDEALELAADNAWAYALVGEGAAGEAELMQARALLPRLEQAAARLPAARVHALWDTVACIRFAAGEWERAAEAWRTALAGVEADAATDAAGRAAPRALYERRLQAALANAARPPGEPPLPLPPHAPALPPP